MNHHHHHHKNNNNNNNNLIIKVSSNSVILCLNHLVQTIWSLMSLPIFTFYDSLWIMVFLWDSKCWSMPWVRTIFDVWSVLRLLSINIVQNFVAAISLSPCHQMIHRGLMNAFAFGKGVASLPKIQTPNTDNWQWTSNTFITFR